MEFLRKITLYQWVIAVMLLGFALLPAYTYLFDQSFYLSLGTKIVIWAIAAVSLNLILGYGGMASFGHAAYFGIGAYCVGIPVHYEIFDGFYHIPLAVYASAQFALITGAIALRTKGVYFIMITMAFAQMVFFAFVSIEEYGGDDGLVIEARSNFGNLLPIDNNIVLYYVCFVSLLASIYLVHRIVHSRFGVVIRGSKTNERRMQALGYNTYLYKLYCYVLAGAMCGFAGALFGNFNGFISPDTIDWTHSGELMFMVIVGGASTLFGPLLGASFFLILEEVLGRFTIYWHLPFGILLILIVLFARGGISGLLNKWGGK